MEIDEIILRTIFLPDDASLKERLFCIKHNIESIVRCPCGGKSKFTGKRYNKYCSNSCARLFSKEKREKTCLLRYGVKNAGWTPASQEKIKSSMIMNHGVEFAQQSKEIREKTRLSNLENFGTDHFLSNLDVRERIKKTNLQKYGFDNPAKVDSIKEKIQDTNRKKYGVNYPTSTQEFKEKISKGLEKYHRENGYNTFQHGLQIRKFTLLSSEDDFKEGNNIIVKCDFCNNVINEDIRNYQRISCNCKARNFSSIGEKRIVDYIRSLGFKVEENNRKLIYPLELDVYIPDMNLAIEFNGVYWHSELSPGNKGLKTYHVDKRDKCDSLGIRLIQFWDFEWESKQDICKSIIKNALGLHDKKIWARQCKLKEIYQKEYNEFLELNHIQGKSIAKTRLGLFYKDELISVAGFSSSRFKRDECELIRFCSKLGYKVPYALKRFISFIDKDIISYCDLRIFDGNGYKKTGFTLINKSKPNYFYFHKSNTSLLFSRLQFQKHKLKDKLETFDENLTEWENMLNNGYNRVWDCGSLKMEYKC